MLLIATAAVATLLACGLALAAAGDLDRSFGGDGRVTTRIGEDAIGQDLIVQPDGKLVAAGYRNAGFDSAFALTRYNPDGSLDKGFGRNGRVVTGQDWTAAALARQRDGKLVVVGNGTRNGEGDFVVARYNPGGSLDRTFGEGGVVTTDFDGGAGPGDLVVQPDGKLVVAGSIATDFDQFNIPRGYDAFLVRYKRDGSLDEGFGEGGKVISDSYVKEGNAALVVQPDGKLVAAGYAFLGGAPGAYYDFALARYNSDGSLDRSFGRGGKATTSLDSRYDSISALVLQPDGKLVAGGRCCAGNGGGENASDFALVRYKRDGSLDGTFGRGAKVVTDFFGNPDYLGGLVLQPDGKLVAAGSAEYGSRAPDPYDTDFALARYHRSGALDASFGESGKLTTGFPGTEDYASALVRQPDGKLVVAGTSQTRNRNPDLDEYTFSLARYLR